MDHKSCIIVDSFESFYQRGKETSLHSTFKKDIKSIFQIKSYIATSLFHLIWNSCFLTAKHFFTFNINSDWINVECKKLSANLVLLKLLMN